VTAAISPISILNPIEGPARDQAGADCACPHRGAGRRHDRLRAQLAGAGGLMGSAPRDPGADWRRAGVGHSRPEQHRSGAEAGGHAGLTLTQLPGRRQASGTHAPWTSPSDWCTAERKKAGSHGPGRARRLMILVSPQRARHHRRHQRRRPTLQPLSGVLDCVERGDRLAGSLTS
jgi:hypothetical protein